MITSIKTVFFIVALLIYSSVFLHNACLNGFVPEDGSGQVFRASTSRF
jgi:hypothetical protein